MQFIRNTVGEKCNLLEIQWVKLQFIRNRVGEKCNLLEIQWVKSAIYYCYLQQVVTHSYH